MGSAETSHLKELQCQNIQRALQVFYHDYKCSKSKSEREIIKKNEINNLFLSIFSQINLHIILYQLAKFVAPSCYSFLDIMNTNSTSPNLLREIIRKTIKLLFFLNFHQLISLSYSISRPSLKLLAYRDIMITNFQSPNLQREIIRKK